MRTTICSAAEQNVNDGVNPVYSVYTLTKIAGDDFSPEAGAHVVFTPTQVTNPLRSFVEIGGQRYECFRQLANTGMSPHFGGEITVGCQAHLFFDSAVNGTTPGFYTVVNCTLPPQADMKNYTKQAYTKSNVPTSIFMTDGDAGYGPFWVDGWPYNSNSAAIVHVKGVCAADPGNEIALSIGRQIENGPMVNLATSELGFIQSFPGTDSIHTFDLAMWDNPQVGPAVKVRWCLLAWERTGTGGYVYINRSRLNGRVYGDTRIYWDERGVS